MWQLIKDRYGEFGRVFPRVGKPPKRAIVFRTSQPFNKITALLLAPNEDYATPDRPVRPGQRIEFLGVGQQIVVDGIHPDTREPYRWGDGAHLMLCDHLVAELKACHDAQTGAINELWRKMARPATSPTKTIPRI